MCIFPKQSKIKDVQLTPQNRVTEVTRNGKAYRFYSKGAWEGPVFMMPPADWVHETRSRSQIEREMIAKIETGTARAYPSANAI
jgi:hypothetical protein